MRIADLHGNWPARRFGDCTLLRQRNGETALLRQMLGALRPGDVLIADGYYCTYWLLAMCKARGVEVVMKNHHKREDQPVDARPICKGQRKVVWPRPQCPDWMSKQEYATIPRSIEIRLVDVQVNEPGFRTDQFTVATTILDHRVFTTECSPPSVHHRVFTSECSPPSVHLRVFTSECSPPSGSLRPIAVAGWWSWISAR